MILDEMIKEKVRVQSLLAKEAKYDISTLLENAHKEVVRLEKEMGIKFKYAKEVKAKPEKKTA